MLKASENITILTLEPYRDFTLRGSHFIRINRKLVACNEMEGGFKKGTSKF